MSVWHALEGQLLSPKMLVKSLRDEAVPLAEVKRRIRRLIKAGYVIQRTAKDNSGAVGTMRYYRPDAPPADSSNANDE